MNVSWNSIEGYSDITYAKKMVSRVLHLIAQKCECIAQEQLLNYKAFYDAQEDNSIGVVLLSGKVRLKDGVYSFCSGGDQKPEVNKGTLMDRGRQDLTFWRCSD